LLRNTEVDLPSLYKDLRSEAQSAPKSSRLKLIKALQNIQEFEFF